jgi:hypothetical protein
MRKPPGGKEVSASPVQTAREGSVPHCGRRAEPSLARNPGTVGGTYMPLFGMYLNHRILALMP